MVPININSFIVCYCFGYCSQGGRFPFLRHSLHSSFMGQFSHAIGFDLLCEYINNDIITKHSNKYIISYSLMKEFIAWKNRLSIFLRIKH